MTRQCGDERVTAGWTLIRRYVLALPRYGADNEAAVTAASVPPLSGGPGGHGRAGTHVLTIAADAAAIWGVVPEPETTTAVSRKTRRSLRLPP